MERHGNTIFFDPIERSLASLPFYIEVEEAPEMFEHVDRLRRNCGASLMELAGEDTHEVHHLHQAKAIGQFTKRYNQLEAISRGLGGLVSQEMDEIVAADIVDSCLAEVPGLALDRLHQE